MKFIPAIEVNFFNGLPIKYMGNLKEISND